LDYKAISYEKTRHRSLERFLKRRSREVDYTKYYFVKYAIFFTSRFEEGVGTNPEELVAAAHAGCFTMQLTAFIGETAAVIESIDTKCVINLVEGSIIGSHLTVQAKISGITDAVFQELVTKAEKNCPISKLFNTEITTTATLV